MSVPAAKAFSPAPVMTSALTDLSSWIRRHCVTSPSYIAKVSALRAWGRLRTMRAMAPSCETSSSSVPVEGSMAITEVLGGGEPGDPLFPRRREAASKEETRDRETDGGLLRGLRCALAPQDEVR